MSGAKPIGRVMIAGCLLCAVGLGLSFWGLKNIIDDKPNSGVFIFIGALLNAAGGILIRKYLRKKRN